MRWAEIGLFLAPLALYLAWRLAAAGQMRPAALLAVVAMVALLAGGTVWLGLAGRMDPRAAYVPAHMQDGKLVPGHAADGS